MADNSASVALINELLATGARTVVIDGVSVTLDPASLRDERRRLQQADPDLKRRRPIVSTFNLRSAAE